MEINIDEKSIYNTAIVDLQHTISGGVRGRYYKSALENDVIGARESFLNGASNQLKNNIAISAWIWFSIVLFVCAVAVAVMIYISRIKIAQKKNKDRHRFDANGNPLL